MTMVAILHVGQNLMFYVLIKVYDVENKLFLNKMSIFFTIYKFVLFIGLYFNVIWQMLIFFSVTQFFGFTYKKIQPSQYTLLRSGSEWLFDQA